MTLYATFHCLLLFSFPTNTIIILFFIWRFYICKCSFMANINLPANICVSKQLSIRSVSRHKMDTAKEFVLVFICSLSQIFLKPNPRVSLRMQNNNKLLGLDQISAKELAGPDYPVSVHNPVKKDKIAGQSQDNFLLFTGYLPQKLSVSEYSVTWCIRLIM